ncbi:MAG: DUF5683 domain-containing protein [Marinifilaceae bacterium]|nr:DUF5683 domain-containing protein [Marinifilaceae bacterium]
MRILRFWITVSLVFTACLLITNNTYAKRKVKKDSISIVERKHSPHKATMYSLVLPGLGQIYNKKYWKLPILYAGIGATIYAINWNTKNYNKYKNGYKDFTLFMEYKYRPEDSTLEKPTGTSYEKLYTTNFDESSESFDSWFKTQLQNKKDSYKHDRDLSYIILVGVYVLNLVDAAIDAHFNDFNISEDLTVNVNPTIKRSFISGNTIGLTCTINF